MTETFDRAENMRVRLVELSRDGRAWAYSVVPFSHDVTFAPFASPCRVPDGYREEMVLTDHKIAYNGKLVNFTKAAIVREQNRGIGCQ